MVAGWRVAYSRGLAAQQLSAPEHTGLGQLGFQWVAEWARTILSLSEYICIYCICVFRDVNIDDTKCWADSNLSDGLDCYETETRSRHVLIKRRKP